jgi:hypothetical protein
MAVEFILILPQGSCSRIWQRDSYWNACPSSRRYFDWKSLCFGISVAKFELLLLQN